MQLQHPDNTMKLAIQAILATTAQAFIGNATTQGVTRPQGIIAPESDLVMGLDCGRDGNKEQAICGNEFAGAEKNHKVVRAKEGPAR